MSRPRLAALATAVLVSCAQGEAEREEQAMKAASPERLQSDGSIRLTDQDKTVLGLEVTEAIVADLPRAALRYGRVRVPTGQEALVVSPVPGRIPRAPMVERGAVVALGAPLLDVIPVLGTAERVSLGVQGADIAGQVESTKRDLLLRAAEAARARELAASGLETTAGVQTAETAVATTRARLDALTQARGVQRGAEGSAVTLRAPVAGTVVSLVAEIGNVTQAGEVLVRILREGTLWVDLAVPPEEPSGLAYEVMLGTSRIPARLISRGSIVEDDGTRHDRVEVLAATASGLLPGAIVGVSVARDVEKGVVVPAACLVPAAEGDLVYVESTANVYVPRPVRVAARVGERVRLASGVEPGEHVVARGAMSLRGESLRNELRPGD